MSFQSKRLNNCVHWKYISLSRHYLLHFASFLHNLCCFILNNDENKKAKQQNGIVFKRTWYRISQSVYFSQAYQNETETNEVTFIYLFYFIFSRFSCCCCIFLSLLVCLRFAFLVELNVFLINVELMYINIVKLMLFRRDWIFTLRFDLFATFFLLFPFVDNHHLSSVPIGVQSNFIDHKKWIATQHIFTSISSLTIAQDAFIISFAHFSLHYFSSSFCLFQSIILQTK